MNSPWRYSTTHNSPCQVIDEQTLWGQIVTRIWLPDQNTVVRVPSSTLQPLNTKTAPEIDTARIAYLASAAKVAEVLEGSSTATDGHVLLAPMESNVIPLPHQIQALSRALTGDRVRYLLADEVGLGKTIEAGLILRELKLRGLVRRTLVVAPKGLATQWVAEMRNHFSEDFQLIFGDDLKVLKGIQNGSRSNYWSKPDGIDKLDISNSANPWQVFDQVVVSLDSVKPLDKRRGWSREQVDEYNRARFEDLITAGWDLVVVDEAHRLGGSSDQVARYKLGKGLAEAAPYILLLSATPHQGKTDAFHRLMNLIDDKAFPDVESVSRERVTPCVIRTEKRKAIDTDGKQLFKPRRTQLVPVAWESRHHLQQQLYEAVTDYVREGYNKALQEKKRHIGFLMILMQRLVVSSTRAIRTTLERRHDVLQGATRQASMRLASINKSEVDSEDSDDLLTELYDMDAQEQLDSLLGTYLSAVHSESSEVETLLNAARRSEQAGPDAKAEALLEWIYRLQSEENKSDLKVLIFTEFVPTQQMLKEFLEARGLSVVTLNGSMDMTERKYAQDDFRKSHRVLVSTDAGGEGLNLQFAHIIINYDLPWNPMRLEQRIGRVDRIGQPKIVRAINFVLKDSVEFRVREVLEQKLAIIFDEFGIDKTGDVLDSAEVGELFENVFAQAFVNPEGIDTSVDATVAQLRNEIQEARQSSPIYDISDVPDIKAAERLRSHPLSHWVERMTVNYLNSHGGSATRKRSWWDLSWPDGHEHRKAVFNTREADRLTDANLLHLENNRIRGLATSLPQIAEGQALPCVTISELPANVSGLWGLFEIRIQAGMKPSTKLSHLALLRRGYLAVFLSKEGKLFLPTARHIWDTLQTTDAEILGALSQDESVVAYTQLNEAAQQAGQEVFGTLRQKHLTSLSREEERGSVSFASRRKVIERIGLPEVRQFRLSQCDAEESGWRDNLESAKELIPELRPILMMQIVKGTGR